MSRFGIMADKGIQPMYGIRDAFGIRPTYGIGQGGWTPLSLFAAGEQGFWYDPSDLTTLFQDAAGVTPVTAVEQPVRLMLDKSKGGVGTNGVRRLNLLDNTEAFSTVAWSGTAYSTTANTDVAPNGTLTADLIAETTANSGHNLFPATSVAVVSGTSYTMSVYAKKGTGATAPDIVQLTLAGGGFGTSQYANFNIVTGAVTFSTGGTASISDAGNGWYRLTWTATATATGSFAAWVFVFCNNDPNALRGPSYTGATTANVLLWGADLRLAADANVQPTYQPITASWPATFAGNHATASADARRPVLSARVNLATGSEFTAGWSVSNASLVTTTATAPPPGITDVRLLRENTSTSTHVAFQSISPSPPAGTYTVSVFAKAAGRDFVVIEPFTSSATFAWYNVANGTLGSNTTGGTATITNVGDGWYRCTLTRTTTGAATVAFFPAQANGFLSYTGDGASGVYLTGADVRPVNDGVGLPAYQRVTTATDYDTTNFPRYLRFDGTDDCLFTGNVDFTATDKVTVCAGVRKLSDAAGAIVTELSATVGLNNGTFALGAPGSAAANFTATVRGTVAVSAIGTPFASPFTAVQSLSGDISGDFVGLRINAASAGTNTADLGTGNLGTYPLYIGARADTSTRLNGRIYQLIGRGALSDAVDLANTEAYVNDKTRAF